MATADQMTRLRAVVPFAQAAQRRWRVPASVSLAQWIYESAWGTDPLVVSANNCFGIKAVAGEKYVEYTTTECSTAGSHRELARFAAYPSVADAFDRHGRLLATSSHYSAAMRALPSVLKFCVGLEEGGYSTSRSPVTHLPDYAVKLMRVIVIYHLTEFDVPPPGVPAAIEEEAA